MSFQWIIDNAESISIDRKKIVSTTTARDGQVRSVERGSPQWKFTVKFPDGVRWTDIRNNISNAERLDKISTATIQINDPGHNWIIAYMGDSSNPSSFTATWTKNSPNITIAGGGSTAVGKYKFRAGDIIQLGTTGRVYTVAQDVPSTSTNVVLHRPVIEDSFSGVLKVGENCSWTVKCVDFPSWTLMARDQVSWSGAFVFVEA